MDVKLRVTMDFTATINEKVDGADRDDKRKQAQDFVKACLSRPETLFSHYIYHLTFMTLVHSTFDFEYDYKDTLWSMEPYMSDALKDLDPKTHGFIFDTYDRLKTEDVDDDHPYIQYIDGQFSKVIGKNARIEMLHPYHLQKDFPLDRKGNQNETNG